MNKFIYEASLFSGMAGFPKIGVKKYKSNERTQYKQFMYPNNNTYQIDFRQCKSSIKLKETHHEVKSPLVSLHGKTSCKEAIQYLVEHTLILKFPYSNEQEQIFYHRWL